MRLPGTLRHTTLGDVLGMLHRARSRGVLEIVERCGLYMERLHRVHLDAGLVRDVESPVRVARLGDILQQQGYIGEHTQRTLARAAFAQRGQRIGEWLVESRAIGRDAIQVALRFQRRAKLDHLFGLRDGRLAFRVRLPRMPPEPLGCLGPAEFLHGRPRRRDEFGASCNFSARPDAARAQALHVLGLPEDAEGAEVTRAFRRLAATWHPDRFPSATSAQRAELMRRFAEISGAYHVLMR